MEQPISKRWETDRRYYLAMLHQDLFGTWMLTLIWGGKKSRLGNQKSKPLPCYQDGIKAIDELNSLRLKHGYRCLPTP